MQNLISVQILPQPSFDSLKVLDPLGKEGGHPKMGERCGSGNYNSQKSVEEIHIFEKQTIVLSLGSQTALLESKGTIQIACQMM